jgi:hypothetical protein
MVNEGEGKRGGMKKAIEFSLESGVEQLEVRRDVIITASDLKMNQTRMRSEHWT